MPTKWRSTLGSRRKRLLITLSETEAQFQISRGTDIRDLGSISYGTASSAQSGPFQPDRLVRYGRRNAEVVARLPRARFLRRTVEFPLAAGENLREVIGFEMDRYTPFKADEVYFDYHLVTKDHERKRLTVDLAIATRATVQSALEKLRAWNLEPDRLDIEDEEKRGAGPFNLLPVTSRTRVKTHRRGLTTALVTVVLLLIVASVLLPVQQKHALLAELEDRLAVAKSNAAQARDLSVQVDGLLERGQFVVQQKRARPPVAELLKELTVLLPDDTWIIRMSWKGERVTLAGISANSSSLVALLEESQLLAGVHFNSPVTVDQRIGLERFNLSANVLPTEAL